ncbi:beta strand repeat-containing protein [Singulisphaera acidiphila]|nr:YDG domain-containing protein [Singulisphaera acidiphila]
MEERVVLSTTPLASLTAASLEHAVPMEANVTSLSIQANQNSDISAEAFRFRKTPTLVTSVSGSGLRDGTATLTATLTTFNGTPLAGKNVRFQVRGRVVGRATTNDEGVAVLSNASLRGIRAGDYPGGVVATFAGDATQRRSSSRGRLTVSRFATSLSDVSASGEFGGNGTLTATLTTNGAPLAGQAVNFLLRGQNVGNATTNAQGVATLTNVSLAGLNTGVYANAITASFAGGVTYQRNAAGGPLAVNQAQATVSLGDLDQTYDGSAKSATVTTSPSGLAYTVSYLDADGTPVANPTAAGSYIVNASIANPNYIGVATGYLVIAKAQIGVDGLTANNKVYDGSTTATLNTGSLTLSGVVPGDDVTLNTAGATGTFASKGVGTGKTVTVAGLTLSGADAGNYVLVQPTTTADVTAATLTVNGLTANNKVYDGTTAATLNTGSLTLSGVVFGDDLTLNTGGATGTFASKGVGTGKTVTVAGLTLSGADAGNYLLVQPSTTADVTAATLTVSGITANNKGYDGTTAATLDTTNAALVGTVPGDQVALDTTNATGTFDSPDIGLDKVVTISGLTLNGADAGNYVLVEPTTTASIGVVTITGITASGKVYDGNTDATIDTTDAVLSGVGPGDDVTLDVSSVTASFETKDAGTGKIVIITGLSLTGADAGKYMLILPTITADITAATLTVSGITASDKVYDGSTDATIDTTNALLDGFVAGDDVELDVSDAVGNFDTKNAGTDKTVTISGLTLSGADAGNYVLASTTTTADITAATLTVSGVTANNKVYDGSTDATLDTTDALLVGFVAGDDVELDVSDAAGNFDTKDAGIGKTVTISGLTLSGADAGNYVLVQPTATADITAATLTVSGVTASGKVYDGSTDATIDTTNALLDGFVAGDDVELDVSGAVGNFDTKDAGTAKTVTILGLILSGADAGNYVLAPTTTTADVTAATLTVSGITAGSKVYDGSTDATLDTTNAQLVGFVAGDDVELDVSDAAGNFDTKDVGTDKTVVVTGLVLTGADLGNYILVPPAATADITAATLTVSGITASDKEYDGNTDATLDTTNASLVGFVAGDDVGLNVSGAVGVFDSPDIGDDKLVFITGLTLVGADSGNYTLTEPTTTASIL